jgi:hypothetical protein
MEVRSLRICKDHWTRLREAIEYRGMKSLISKDGNSMKTRLKDIKSTLKNPTAECFDPFAIATIQISMAFIANVDDEDFPEGQFCPLCEVKAHGQIPDADDDWINGCCDEQLDTARKLNLVPPEA